MNYIYLQPSVVVCMVQMMSNGTKSTHDDDAGL